MNIEISLILDKFSLCKSRTDFLLFTVQLTLVEQFETTDIAMHIMTNTLITLLRVIEDLTFDTAPDAVRTRHNHNIMTANISSENNSFD